MPPYIKYRYSQIMAISEASKQLIAAIQKENKEQLIDSIRNGADINSAIWLKKTNVKKEKLNIIHYAVHKDWLAGVQKLCEDPNLELNKKNGGGYTPLHMALINGENQIARILIKAGANPNVKSNKGNTPLHTAVAMQNSNEIISALLNNKADINIFNEANETPLDRAITKQQWNCAILLLKHASEHQIPCSINRTSQIAFSNYLKENKLSNLLKQLESIKHPTKQKAPLQHHRGNAFIRSNSNKKQENSKNNSILGTNYSPNDYSPIFTKGIHFWDSSDEEENSQEDHSTLSGSKIERGEFEETSSHLENEVNTNPFEIEQGIIDDHHNITQEDNTKTYGCCFDKNIRYYN